MRQMKIRNKSGSGIPVNIDPVTPLVLMLVCEMKTCLDFEAANSLEVNNLIYLA